MPAALSLVFLKVRSSLSNLKYAENEVGLWRSLRLPFFGAPSIFSASEMELDYTVIFT
jgi:hypothetical protein